MSEPLTIQHSGQAKNYDQQLVSRYLAGEITLEDLCAATGQMPMGYGWNTRYMATMGLLEIVARRKT